MPIRTPSDQVARPVEPCARLKTKWIGDELLLGEFRPIQVAPCQAIATDTNEMADEIDRASVEEARRLELNRIEHDKLHLRKLKGALKRINEGDFGYCESCGDEISLKRLQARPESRFCVECQSTKEFNDTHVFRRVA